MKSILNKKISIKITSEIINEIGILTFSNNKNRNALSNIMIKELSEILTSMQHLKVIILSSEGPAFSSGHDLTEITQMNENERLCFFNKGAELMKQIIKEKPVVIAEVQGVTAAAGTTSSLL